MGDGTGVGDGDYWKLLSINMNEPLPEYVNDSILVDRQVLSKAVRYENHNSLISTHCNADVNVIVFNSSSICEQIKSK